MGAENQKSQNRALSYYYLMYTKGLADKGCYRKYASSDITVTYSTQLLALDLSYYDGYVDFAVYKYIIYGVTARYLGRP
jgi:hypothetical protein